MPGWYIHMETAAMVAKRLQDGDLPSDAAIDADDAKQLGDIAHTWRNYLAAGALGPDLFFLLPDFKGDTGKFLLKIVNWTLETWDVLDSEFVSKWEKWAQPAVDGVGDVLNQMSGGLLAELGQALQELGHALVDMVLELFTQLYDWFGLLGSGVPQGFGDSAFFWSDMFHYRKTFEFAKALFDNAQTPQHKAFAVGWMSHCATDVTGHSFVNSKCGGPYRLHWQRHHLVENHMDAKAYDAQHHGVEPYGELDTAALHFRLAFRKGKIDPYLDATDAPAYDYFAGLPPYDTADSAAAAKQRHDFFDLDSGELPDDLCQLIIDTMAQVYGDDGPKILNWDPDEFSDLDAQGEPTGRPSVLALQNMYKLVYAYLKSSSTGGYSPRKPTAPPVFNDHSPPAPPGSNSAHDDPSAGGDPDDDDWNLLDILLAILSFGAWLVELGVWLATLPVALLADILTWPAREILYEFAVVPLWSLYIAARKPLVMEGFLVPKAEEIMTGLVQLGVSTASGQLADFLASPDGFGVTVTPNFDEKSGADPAYPRAVVEDPQNIAQKILGVLLPDPSCGQEVAPSEYLRPWTYPERNNAGKVVGWEAGLTAAGPWKQGQDAEVLMGNAPGDAGARTAFEQADSPAATDQVASDQFAQGLHLGDPVDYGTYVVSRLSAGAGTPGLPDFNLDADRGYGYHCWDWDRSLKTTDTPKITKDDEFDHAHYSTGTPCTVPEGYCADDAHAWPGSPQRLYVPENHVAIHYRDQPNPGCHHPIKVTREEIARAGGLPPEGQS